MPLQTRSYRTHHTMPPSVVLKVMNACVIMTSVIKETPLLVQQRATKTLIPDDEDHPPVCGAASASD
jgi:hypothetical protein